MERSPVNGRRLVVGVTGSIAAYKAAEVVSQLAQRGALVTPMLTRGAAAFVSPLTFQTLSGRRALFETFDLGRVEDPTHIQLAHETELVLIAPATANVLGKLAHGIADDLLTTFLLAVRCPVLIAPAMNSMMWEHPAVRENVKTLQARGAEFLQPGEGFLACGDVGPGRLAEPLQIVAAVERVFSGEGRRKKRGAS
jgi:phosphopantothenoylcysteine decarboxylase/phosphopantothenate--cysteine ligase